jgi:hypothetical protein
MENKHNLLLYLLVVPVVSSKEIGERFTKVKLRLVQETGGYDVAVLGVGRWEEMLRHLHVCCQPDPGPTPVYDQTREHMERLRHFQSTKWRGQYLKLLHSLKPYAALLSEVRIPWDIQSLPALHSEGSMSPFISMGLHLVYLKRSRIISELIEIKEWYRTCNVCQS